MAKAKATPALQPDTDDVQEDKEQEGTMSIPDVDAQVVASEQKRLDETVLGGRYMVNGKLVNCNGEPLEE